MCLALWSSTHDVQLKAEMLLALGCKLHLVDVFEWGRCGLLLREVVAMRWQRILSCWDRVMRRIPGVRRVFKSPIFILSCGHKQKVFLTTAM